MSKMIWLPLISVSIICISSMMMVMEKIHSKKETNKKKPIPKVSKGTTDSSSKSIPLTFNCEICADERKPISTMFRIHGCQHYYCSECVSKYIASKLEDNISVITCPVSYCNVFLELHNCQSILPKQVLDKWGDALCESAILASEKFYCPFKDCSALLIIDDKSDNNQIISQSECPNCNRLICAQCKVPWHNRIKCVEFQKLKEDERSNEDVMLMNLAKNNNWQRCSKCLFFVEKKDGCLSMTCRCGHCFCYGCGAPVKSHLDTCTKCRQ